MKYFRKDKDSNRPRIKPNKTNTFKTTNVLSINVRFRYAAIGMALKNKSATNNRLDMVHPYV